MFLISTILPICIAVLVILLRLRRARKPLSLMRIILPPLFMSSGFTLFLFPQMKITMLHGIESLVTGLFFSVPLILCSKLEIREDNIFLVRSKAFILIFLGLFTVRTAIKLWLGSAIDFYESSGMFYLLAVGMIFPWRIMMLIKYVRLSRSIKQYELSK